MLQILLKSYLKKNIYGENKIMNIYRKIIRIAPILGVLASIVTVATLEINELNFQLSILILEYYIFEVMLILILIFFYKKIKTTKLNKVEIYILLFSLTFTVVTILPYEYKKIHIARYIVGPYGITLLEEKNKYILASEHAKNLSSIKRWRWQSPNLLNKSKEILRTKENIIKYKEIFSRDLAHLDKRLLHEKAIIGEYINNKEILYKMF